MDSQTGWVDLILGWGRAVLASDSPEANRGLHSALRHCPPTAAACERQRVPLLAPASSGTCVDAGTSAAACSCTCTEVHTWRVSRAVIEHEGIQGSQTGDAICYTRIRFPVGRAEIRARLAQHPSSCSALSARHIERASPSSSVLINPRPPSAVCPSVPVTRTVSYCSTYRHPACAASTDTSPPVFPSTSAKPCNGKGFPF